ncbi:MAG: lipopolysaccharide heptosyltransferase, partial [Verrucomicrobiota bacterium]
MRILILKPSSLGDIIHALPTVNLIRRRYPTAHIAWLVNTTFASLLKKCPVIDELIPFDRHRYGS